MTHLPPYISLQYYCLQHSRGCLRRTPRRSTPRLGTGPGLYLQSALQYAMFYLRQYRYLYIYLITNAKACIRQHTILPASILTSTLTIPRPPPEYAKPLSVLLPGSRCCVRLGVVIMLVTGISCRLGMASTSLYTEMYTVYA